MALQGGGDNNTVCRIAVHICQQARTCRDTTINGYLDHPPVQQITPPDTQVKQKIKSTLLNPHSDFPEGYGRDSSPIFLQRACNDAPSLRP